MDPVKEIADFKAFLKESVEHLRQAGVRPSSYEDDSGMSYAGWPYGYVGHKTVEEVNTNLRPMYRGGHWGHDDYFLGTDGSLYVSKFRGVEELDRNDEIAKTITTRVSRIPLRDLVGTGVPFSEVRKQLNTAVFRALAD